MVYTKVVGLNQIYNFVVQFFFQLRLSWHPNTWFKFWILNFQNFQMTSYGKIVYMKVAGTDQIYSFIVEKIFIWDRYSCEIGYISHLKVMMKGKYLNVGHMWWCSPVVGKGMREAEVVGSNPDNAGKNRTRIFAQKIARIATRARWEKENIFWFLFTL